jgi:hypothetical protein
MYVILFYWLLKIYNTSLIKLIGFLVNYSIFYPAVCLIVSIECKFSLFLYLI